ncbi:hypothetical protein MITS9508_02208 [Synechococcus sp. MIT S9508]|nr:hypothetical protein MITS9508_02208 [Synechococcus sp. MIT S9508]
MAVCFSPLSKLGELQEAPDSRMAKRRNLKKEKQERNRAYARKFKKRKMRNDGRGEGAGNGVTGTANNGGAAD